MNADKTTRSNWQGLVPRGRLAIISAIIVAIVAFSLGGLLFSGGDTKDMSADHSEASHANSTASAEPTMWTCSMHPQIMLPKPGKCPICFMDLIPIETGSSGGELDPNQIRLSATAVELAKIQTSLVTRAFAQRSVRMVGKLQYDETRVSYITAWVPGRLDRLYIDYTGASVRKGDPMVEMYSPDLIAAQGELVQAQKAVASISGSSSDVLRSTTRATLRSAREKLRLYGLSEAQITAVEEDGFPENEMTLTAPTSGVVVHKDAKEGMYVATGTKIYTIADLSKLWVMLEAYESDLPWLKIGQRMTFTSPSFPGETFDAKISFIDPVVDPKSRTVEVRAEVNNRDGRLKPEMFVSGNVQSRLDEKGNVLPANATTTRSGDKAPLLIPATAPLLTGKRAVVYVDVPDKDGIVYEGREVVLGSRAGDYYVVKEGLNEGETVVTHGAFRIDSELQIQAKPSMMSLASAKTEAPHEHTEQEHPETVAMEKPKAPSEPYKAGDASRLQISDEALNALSPMYLAYFDVQMALANDSLTKAKDAFSRLKKTSEAVNMALFSGEAHMRWMKISKAIIAGSTDGSSADDIAAARDAFYQTSQAIIELHDSFGHVIDRSFYLTFCPMARDNKGAFWLQQENIVWNSFYGSTMLRCGEIKKELTADKTAAE